MFQTIRDLGGRVGRFFKKSAAQRKILEHLNGNTSVIVGNLWSTDRMEYPTHFTGWNYAAIDAIATEVAGMIPRYAWRRTELTAAQKAQRKCLDINARRKAIVGLQSNHDLEPVPSDHQYAKINARPNEVDIGWTYWYKVVMFLRISGEAYIWDVRNKAGFLKESWIIPSHWVWPIIGTDRLVGEYEIRPTATYVPGQGGAWGWFGGATGTWKIPAEQIIPMFLPSPHTLVGGFSPLAACSAWTDCSGSIDKSRVFKFQNDAFPNVAVVFDKEIEPDSISLPEIERLKLMIKEKYSGVRRTGEPAILGPGMSLQILSNTPRDMDYCQGFDQLRDALMGCHRTGPIMVGMSNETTHASGRAARAGWHSSTITPLVEMMGQFITERRCKPHDPDLVCYWTTNKPQDVEFEHKQRMDFFDRNLLTVDESRAQVDLPPHLNREIGGMTSAEVQSHLAMPDVGPESFLPEPESDKREGVFKPAATALPPMLVDRTPKALHDLRDRFLIPSTNGKH